MLCLNFQSVSVKVTYYNQENQPHLTALWGEQRETLGPVSRSSQ